VVANGLGFKTVIVIPDTQSQEKKDALRLMGAELIEVPAVPYKDPNNYVKLSGRLAEQLSMTEKNGAIWANQFGQCRPTARRISKAPARRSGSRPAARWTASSARSGRAARWAASPSRSKNFNREIKIAAADPLGAAIYSWIKTGNLESHGASITEGIGQSRVTANLEGAPIDDAYEIPDEEALPIVFDLLAHEGLCMGGSTGINIAGAIRMAREMGPGHTIVTMLCDYGNRYQSKLFNPAFLKEKGLPAPPWLVEQRKPIHVPYE